MNISARTLRAALTGALCFATLAVVPWLGLPEFYVSFLYMTCFWVALSSGWSILGGYAGYLSLGHAAFFGVGVYTTATLAGAWGVPFLWTIPVAALLAALLGLAVGAVAFRLNALRGEMFALLTLAVTFILSTIVLNTDIDGGQGVFLSAVPVPAIAPDQSGTIYLLGLVIATLAVGTSFIISRSRLGMGLFAIHDDEDVAEVKGVPTLRYKLVAFAISAGLAGAIGGVHAIYIGYVTVAETFAITVPLYVILMAVLGGSRHWAGPVVGAALINASTFAFLSGGQALLGRALVALALIVVMLALPAGIVPTILVLFIRARRMLRPLPARPPAPAMPDLPPVPAGPAGGAQLLECRDVAKNFGGLHALRGVSLEVRRGEILGLVGPNGSGKTTLINMISGHFPLSGGSILFDGAPLSGRRPHKVARLGIARTYQIPRPFAHLTALDNVALSAAFGLGDHRSAATRADARSWLEFCGLAAHENDLPAQLNLHARKFLELARALAARPRLLLLDEVLAGLNPAEVDSAIRLIRRIRDSGVSILFVEHLMRAVMALSDRVAVLNEGGLIAIGAPEQTMRDPLVIATYLGSAHVA